MPATRSGLALMLGAAALLFVGCTGATEPTRRYVIDAAEQRGTVRQASAQDGPIVAIAPVIVPEYLNQNGIVTRNGENEITRAESDVWAGPLSEEIARAVAENLSSKVPTDRITLSAGRRSIPVDYTVEIEIVRFERQAGDNAVNLVARWTVFLGDERSVLTMRRSRHSKPVAGPEYRDVVAAMSDAVASLSEEIAAVIAQGRNVRGGGRVASERSPRSSSGDPSRATSRPR